MLLSSNMNQIKLILKLQNILIIAPDKLAVRSGA